MTSEIKADKWSPASGTAGTIGDSGDTFTVPTGVGLTVTDEVKTNKISPASGTAFTLGDSGDTFTIPSGVTFANSGTATGFDGGLVPVGSVDSGGNVGEVTLDNKFSATYKNYLILIDKMIPASDGANIQFKLRDDTPSSISSDYGLVARAYRANDNGLSSRSGDGESLIQVTDAGISNSSNKMGLKMAFWIQDPFASTVYTGGHGTFQYINNSGYTTGGYIQFLHHSNASPRGLTMFASTGNINGRIRAYGVVDS